MASVPCRQLRRAVTIRQLGDSCISAGSVFAYGLLKKATRTLIIQSDSTVMLRADRIACPRPRLGDFLLMFCWSCIGIPSATRSYSICSARSRDSFTYGSTCTKKAMEIPNSRSEKTASNTTGITVFALSTKEIPNADNEKPTKIDAIVHLTLS